MSSIRIKHIFFFCALFFISFLAAIITAEIAIRIYIKLQGTKLGINRIEHFARSWPLLQGVEGKKYYFELKPSIQKTLEGVFYKVNDQGLRSNKDKFFSDPEAYHVYLSGASQTFGVGVDFEDTWACQLENKLNEHYKSQGKSFQIWDGGVPGRHMEQNIMAFEQRYIGLKPDMVILTFAVDIFVRPSWHYKGGILYVPEKGYWFQQMVYRSRLLSYMVFRYKNQRFNPYSYYNNYYAMVDEKWDYAMEQVKYLHRLCKKNSMELLVLDITTPFWQGRLKKEDWIEYKYNLKLEKLCKTEGIHYNNTITYFEGLEAGPLWAIPDYDCHYNPKATKLVAESLFQEFININPEKKTDRN